MTEHMFDILLSGGRIVDGAGNPWYHGDIAVKDGRIAAIGKISEGAETVIQLEGMVAAPGFIDTHSHSDLMLISEPRAEAKVMQGVTTEIVGQDGLGEAPVTDGTIKDWRKYLSGLNGDPDIEWTWRGMGGYLDALEKARPSINVASLVGHGNIRLCVMGMEDREPTGAELDEMRALTAESMEQGAIGLSTGLIYAPCIYADTPELVELCRVVAGHGGSFVVHIRNEGDRLLESIDEVAQVGRESGVHVHVSHFKAGGEANWGKSVHSLRRLEEARSGGVEMTFDQYPYIAGSTFLSSLLPPWVHAGGTDALLGRLRDEEARRRIADELGESTRAERWESLLVTNLRTARNLPYEGKTMAEIAGARRQDPVTALMDIVVEEDNGAAMVSFTMNEDDVERIMSSPLGMVCTDGILLGKPHPRAYGAFPRVLGHYVRRGVLRLEEAVRRMTSHPAQAFGLTGRGLLRPGFKADITVFDPKKILDTATYDDPRRHPEGIAHVIVNGVVTVSDGEHTGASAGQVHRHGQG
ncbi:D-aminoacylase [Candidatus Bathyarchaeota archaeon]|nr:D-aminoacylase [Candidatus Bathyarchaeota archaeon]